MADKVNREQSSPAGCDPPVLADSAGPGAHARTVAELFRKCNRSLISLLSARLHSVEEAKEVAQEAYVKLLQLDRPGTVSLLQAYLFRTACNLAVDRVRQRSTHERLVSEHAGEIFEDLAGPEALIEARALAEGELQVLQASLEELSEKCRRTFLLYRVEGLDQETIARRLGITRRMVRYYTAYALKYCRLRMGGVTAPEARGRLKRQRWEAK